MALEQPLFNVGFMLAAADLRTKQYYFVKDDGNGGIVLCGAGEAALGILQNAPNSGEVADVAVLGISKVVCSAALSAGAAIASDLNGKAKAAVAGKTDTSDAGAAADALLGSYVMGRLLRDVGGATELGTFLLQPVGAVPTTAS